MRVLHVITALTSGGAEQQLRDLVRHTRHRAEVVSLTTAGPVAEQIRAEGTPVTDLGMRSNVDLTVLPRLAALIRRGRFDVVHCHLWRACLYGRLAGRMAGCPIIVATEHSLGTDMTEDSPLERPSRRRAYLATERMSQMTVAVSPTVVDCLLEWGVRPERIRMIPDGIDLAEFRFDPAARWRVRAHWGIDQGATVVGLVCRLVASKCPEGVLAAVRGLPGVVLLVVGEGPERTRLRELALDWGMADRVVFTGQTKQASEMYSAMDVFATASPHETFGLTIVEAIAAGLPTAYVHCPALDDLSGSSPPGVHRTGSDPAVLRETIARLITEPRRPQPALAAYDITRTAAATDALYESLRDPRRSTERGPEVPA